MTASLPRMHPTTAAPSSEAVVWVYDPWREHPRTALLAAACALGLCALTVALRLPFLLAAGLCVFCVASFAPALSPVECRIDAAGPARRGLLGWDRRRWVDVRRIDRVAAGVLLSPFASRRWLDATRALMLPLPERRRAELVAAVERLRAAHAD